MEPVKLTVPRYGFSVTKTSSEISPKGECLLRYNLIQAQIFGAIHCVQFSARRYKKCGMGQICERQWRTLWGNNH
ncbi:hypothetical protein Tcan_18426 [Toxocara canis]|uniref:Uncharacterized protein n=1 Tax=Toxocara canis TaxID=6265 RepID=A0A0B2VSF4_TOXCA|nr:hypothetical protein Tcan_18426 [Toxocara canis]